MDIQNPLIKWHIHRMHRLVQRKRRPGVIQTVRLVHHVPVKRRRDLVRLTIVHRPHRSDHRPETKELHRRREVDRLIRALQPSYDMQRDTQIQDSSNRTR